MPQRMCYESCGSENDIKVLRQKYLSFSDKNIFRFNTFTLTQLGYERAVKRALGSVDYRPDIIYGHFLYPDGAAAIHLGEKLKVPAFISVGESSFWSVRPIGFEKARQDYRKVTGIVAVSNLIKRSLISELKISEEKIGVFPNGTDLSMFYPRDKSEMRKKYGLPQHKIIAAFVGHFDERKGPHRVLKAVESLENVGVIFLGTGKIKLDGRGVLFKGVLQHSHVPEILSAADMFVLPTLVEGSCNAIVEAMACGLPVITSKGEFNDDIVDDKVSIRVDPQSIPEIRAAVTMLSEDAEFRSRLSGNALKMAIKLDVNVRARKILDWMNSMAPGSR